MITINPKVKCRWYHLRTISLIFIVCALFSTLVHTQEVTDEPPDPIQLALAAPKRFAEVQDYTAIFYKQEFLNGKLLPEEKIILKFRRPFDIYMKWIGKPYKNREMLYRKGQNRGKLMAHEGGFLGLVTVSLDPRGSIAMKGNHHPIYDAGIGSTINLVLRGLNKGLERNEVEVVFNGKSKIEGRDTYIFMGVFPKKLEGSEYVVSKGDDLWSIAEKFNKDMYVILANNKGIDDPYDVDPGQKILIPYYYCQKITVYLDVEWGIPVKLLINDWQGNLYESYRYSQLKINVGLTDQDFDPDNPQYKF